MIKHMLKLSIYLWKQYPNIRDIISTFLFSNISLFPMIKYHDNKKYHKFKKKISKEELKIKQYQTKLNEESTKLKKRDLKINESQKDINLHLASEFETDKLINELKHIIKDMNKADKLSKNRKYIRECETKFLLKTECISDNRLIIPKSMLRKSVQNHTRHTVITDLYKNPISEIARWCNNLNFNIINNEYLINNIGDSYIKLIDTHKTLFAQINSDKKIKVCYTVYDEIKRIMNKGDNNDD